MTQNFETVAAAYQDGVGRIDCPVCDGGPSGECGTMSVWRTDDGHIMGQCWRASCGVTVRGGHSTAVAPKPFTPNPLTDPYRMLTPADGFGTTTLPHCRVLVSQPSTLVWRLKSLDGRHTGHVTRTRDKIIRTYKEADRGIYYCNLREYSGTAQVLWMFEDPMSAAMCRRPAIGLLGTRLGDDVVEDIRDWGPRNVLVALDPGAEDDALTAYTKLVQAGVPATYVPMSKDFKDMSDEARYALEQAYS